MSERSPRTSHPSAFPPPERVEELSPARSRPDSPFPPFRWGKRPGKGGERRVSPHHRQSRVTSLLSAIAIAGALLACRGQLAPSTTLPVADSIAACVSRGLVLRVFRHRPAASDLAASDPAASDPAASRDLHRPVAPRPRGLQVGGAALQPAVPWPIGGGLRPLPERDAQPHPPHLHGPARIPRQATSGTPAQRQDPRDAPRRSCWVPTGRLSGWAS